MLMLPHAEKVTRGAALRRLCLSQCKHNEEFSCLKGPWSQIEQRRNSAIIAISHQPPGALHMLMPPSTCDPHIHDIIINPARHNVGLSGP